MSRDEAQECFEHMIKTILKPPAGLTAEEVKVFKQAEEFLENVSEYVPKRKPN
jgi:hypothetical protein